MPTGITWCDETWNPISGCTPISEGCENCYARAMAKRLQGMGQKGYENGFEVTLHKERINQPSRWRKPRRVFVVSMGDLFHEDVPMAKIKGIWNVAFNVPRHTYLFLTKRPGRLKEFTERAARAMYWPIEDIWPDWMWIGTTVENQDRAEERLGILLDTPAVHRFVSCEPLLGPVRLSSWLGYRCIEWVIVGGESGPGHRPMEIGWARSIREQCKEKGIPFHFKQYSGHRPEKCPELDGVRHTARPPFGEGP